MALLAALANAIASICQRLGVEDAPAGNGPSVGLVRHMLARPVWLLGFVIMALGFAAQAVALHLGELNVVQPILVSELVMLVFALWFWYATPLRARDFLAAFATALGLGVFLFVSSPSDGSKAPSDHLWSEVGFTIVVVVIILVVIARRGPAWWRALVLGAAASTGFALLSAITKSMTNLLVAGWGPLFTSWQLYALALIGLGSFVIMQSAFQVGPFAASQSTLILVNPFVAIAIGYVLFDETLRGGPLYATLEVAALAVMVVGAMGLASSSLVADVHESSDGSELLKGRGRYARWRQHNARH